MILCNYGCGNEGKYQLKNGKWCCSKHWSSCPEIKKKTSRITENRFKICENCNKKILKANHKKHLNACKRENFCLECGEKLTSKDNRAKFCSHKCAGIYNNKNSEGLKSCRRGPISKNKIHSDEDGNYICQQCGIKFKGRPRKFCSHKCAGYNKYIKNVEKWISGETNGMYGKVQTATFVRNYIIERDGKKCSMCSWDKIHQITGKVPIHLDHIDGNWKNNKPDNLRMLCPNCHSLTENYGILNNGNGRPDNRKRY